MRAIALFPYNVQIGPQRFPLFSDNDPSRIVQGALLRRLAGTLDLPQLVGVDPVDSNARTFTTRYPAEQIRDFTWWDDAESSIPPATRNWLPDTAIFVARAEPEKPDGLILAAKAGHNAEPHNHNDVGSFIIALNGVMPVAEIGAGIYDRGTFDKAVRYQRIMYGSQGHSVPVINGQYQEAGPDHAARDVVCEGDVLSMDLAPCYPAAAGATCVLRRLALDREKGAITVEDRAEFAQPGTMASVLISATPVEIAASGLLRLGPLAVHHDPALTVSVEPLSGIERRRGGSDALTRITFAPTARSREQTILLRFEDARAC
jgi:hypothetical protein